MKNLIFLSFYLFFSVHIKSQVADTCMPIALTAIRFDKNKINLTTKAKKQLDSIALTIKMHPHCKVEVVGTDQYLNRYELAYQRIWDRVNTVIGYLKKKGVNGEQLVFMYGETNEPRMVKLAFNDIEIPFTPAPPCPAIQNRYSTRKAIRFDGHTLPLETE